MLENLIYAGTFDTFGYNRSELIAVYDTVLDRVAKDVNAKASGQFSFSIWKSVRLPKYLAAENFLKRIS